MLTQLRITLILLAQALVCSSSFQSVSSLHRNQEAYPAAQGAAGFLAEFLAGFLAGNPRQHTFLSPNASHFNLQGPERGLRTSAEESSLEEQDWELLLLLLSRLQQQHHHQPWWWCLGPAPGGSENKSSLEEHSPQLWEFSLVKLTPLGRGLIPEQDPELDNPSIPQGDELSRPLFLADQDGLDADRAQQRSPQPPPQPVRASWGGLLGLMVIVGWVLCALSFLVVWLQNVLECDPAAF
jgi:hypothetical protein